MPKLSIKKVLLADMLGKMYEIRFFEEKIEEFFMQNLIGGTVHLYIGEDCSTDQTAKLCKSIQQQQTQGR